MKTNLAVLLAGLALGAGPAVAQALEELKVALPARHELVELQPGLQVIPDFELEVFSTGGAYWLRSGGLWYSTRQPAASATFTLADPRSVPAALARLPDGSHLYYRAAPGQARSTRALEAMPPPERLDEPEAAPAKAAPPPAGPAAAATAAPAAPAAPAVKPAAKPATKPAAKPAAPAKTAPLPRKAPAPPPKK